jgi:hypothetical protein
LEKGGGRGGKGRLQAHSGLTRLHIDGLPCPPDW